ncbi:hypothetical protein B0H13DRAFT_2062628 [Mycena leptocephala]|nr:hypothetical protein B0H13DRAFT_2062628 [Mycena leptocephala]
MDRTKLYSNPGILLQVLVPHRARWEHVKLHIPLSQLLPIEEALPLLRELEIQVAGPSSPTATFPEMPRLHTVTLWDFDYPAALLPWSQLTSLTLIAKEPHQCTPILLHTTNLLHCELILFDNDEAQPQPDITLPRLESLLFVHFAADYMSTVGYLPSFIVPALRRLQIPENCVAGDPVAVLASFISKSGCKLEQLHITGERSISQNAYRTAFSSISKVSFNSLLTDWYCDAADAIRKRGTQSMADFESGIWADTPTFLFGNIGHQRPDNDFRY